MGGAHAADRWRRAKGRVGKGAGMARVAQGRAEDTPVQRDFLDARGYSPAFAKTTCGVDVDRTAVPNPGPIVAAARAGDGLAGAIDVVQAVGGKRTSLAGTRPGKEQGREAEMVHQARRAGVLGVQCEVSSIAGCRVYKTTHA